MNFEVVDIAGFDNEPVPFENDIEVPQCKKNSNLPNNFFVNLTIGSTGSGKTFSVVKLLKYYEKKKMYYKSGVEAKQRIILFTLTPDTNPIYSSLKNLDPDDIHPCYSDQMLDEVINDITEQKEKAEAYMKFAELYKKYKKLKYPERVLDYNDLMLLEHYDFDIENYPKPKYEAPCVVHMLFDDLLCSGAFKSTGNSLLSNFSTRGRHIFCNIFFMSQSANQIPKLIRNQARLLMLYRYNSKTICKDLHQLVSGKLTEEEFESIYFKCTSGKYQFFTIDNTHSDIIFKQNFDKLIKIK